MALSETYLKYKMELPLEYNLVSAQSPPDKSKGVAIVIKVSTFANV